MLLPSKGCKLIMLWMGRAAAAGQDYRALSLDDWGLHN